MSMKAYPFTLVYILGSGHCGSTLLDMMLNGHPYITALGELARLHSYIGLWRGRIMTPEVEAATRGGATRPRALEVWEHNLDTPFWVDVREHYERSTGQAFDDIRLHHPSWFSLATGRADWAQWKRRNLALLKSIGHVAGTPFLTDSSKSPQRLLLLERTGLFDVRVINLVRDGRAIYYSYLRKYHSAPLAMRRWGGRALMALYVLGRIQHSRWIRVRYEDLSSQPDQTLRGICDFLGIEFVPDMVAFRRQPYMGIGGNRMRMDSGEEIRLDERWKTALTARDRIIFELVGGWLNALYGY